MPYHLQRHLSRKNEITIIDRLMMVAAVVHPLSAIPQVYIIYSTKDAAGVSLLTWIFFMIIGLVFLAYGLAHRIKPFIFNQILWFIVDALVVTGVILYD